jgi:Kef-type K+ transport system membrane component KefB
MEFHVPPLLIVLAVAVIAPLLGEFTTRFGLPVVVLELLLGVLIGPHALGWATVSGAVTQLALFGLGFLFFLAGMEMDLVGMRPQLKGAIIGWLLAFAIGALAALAMRSLGLINAWVAVAIAIPTTALGVLIPVLRDTGILETPLGKSFLAAGAVAEIGPIIAMSLALSTAHSAPVQTAFTVAFLFIVALVGLGMLQARTPAILSVLSRTMTQSSQLPIRLGVLFMVGLALLAEVLGLDLALGALAAGMLLGLATRGLDVHALHTKLDAIGFGFLVPVFFITSGMKLEVAAIFSGSAGLAVIAAFLAALLLARVPLVALHWRALGAKHATALGLFSATTLSLIVALTDIAVKRGLMTGAEAAPLVGAGMLTVILFPALGLKLAGGKSRRNLRAGDDRDGL